MTDHIDQIFAHDPSLLKLYRLLEQRDLFPFGDLAVAYFVYFPDSEIKKRLSTLNGYKSKMCRILAQSGSKDTVETVRGQGYRLIKG